MTAFCWVAEFGSFAAAAERLDLSGPMISKYIAHLEQHLGVCLLNRTTRKVNLTETGRHYYSRCKQLLTDLTEPGRYDQPNRPTSQRITEDKRSGRFWHDAYGGRSRSL